MKRGSLLLLVVFLSACSAGGPTFKTVKSDIPSLNAQQSRIYYYRTSRVVGSAVRQWIFLDETRIGKSENGGVFYVDVKPGEHVSMIPNKGVAGQNSFKFKIAAGETKYIRTWTGAGQMRINQEIVPAETAIPEVDRLSFTGKIARK